MLMSFYAGGRKRAVAGAVVVSLLAIPAAFGQQAVQRVINEQGEFDRGSRASQERITRYAQQTSELLGEYRVVLQQLDRVKIYNENLEAVVNDQAAGIQDIEDDLANFEETEQGIVPLMLDMIADLRRFVEADMPFLQGERALRVENLENIMTDSDVTNSEKYRQIMEAYRIEADYGDTIEAYEGTVNIDGTNTTVDFLRVGRVVLAYQTRDQKTTGLWNKESRQWEVLDSSYRRAVSDGLALARKQAAPSLLVLPVPGPEAAQ